MFSKKTPIKILGKDSDINLNRLSNDEGFFKEFYMQYKNPNLNDIRIKLFDAYNKFKTNFPFNDMPSGEIRNLCLTLINGFYNANRSLMSENFDSIDDYKLEELSFRTKDILKRMFNTDNVLLTFDKTETESPIKVFIDAIQDQHNLTFDPLDFSVNNGFFKFAHPSRVNILIIVSIKYIRNLFNTNYSQIRSIVQDATNIEENETEDTSFKFGSNYYLKINDIIAKFWSDLKSAFVFALYKDRYRESVYSQIYGIISLLDYARKTRYNVLEYGSEEDMIELWKATSEIKNKLHFYKFKEKDKHLIDRSLTPTLFDLIYDFICIRMGATKVNAADFYSALFEPTQHELNTLRVKLSIFETSDVINVFDHLDATISDLNHNYNYETTNLAVTVILLKRIIPIIILTEFILGYGNKYSEVRGIFDKVMNRMASLESLANATPYLTNSLLRMTNEYKSIIELTKTHRTIFVNSKIISTFIGRYVYANNLNVKNERLDLTKTVIDGEGQNEE